MQLLNLTFLSSFPSLDEALASWFSAFIAWRSFWKKLRERERYILALFWLKNEIKSGKFEENKTFIKFKTQRNLQTTFKWLFPFSICWLMQNKPTNRTYCIRYKCVRRDQQSSENWKVGTGTFQKTHALIPSQFVITF